MWCFTAACGFSGWQLKACGAVEQEPVLSPPGTDCYRQTQGPFAIIAALGDNPGPDALLELIGQELRGSPVYAMQEADSDAIAADELQRAADEFANWLFNRDIDPKTATDAEIMAAMAEAEREVAEGRSFEQSRAESDAYAWGKWIDRLASSEPGRIPELLRVMHAPPVLRFLGMPNRGIFIRPSKMGKIGTKHALSVDVWRALPSLLNRPLVVLPNWAEKGRLIAILDATDLTGQPVIVSIDPNGRDQSGNETGVIVTLFGQSDDEATGETAYAYLSRQIGNALAAGGTVYDGLRDDGSAEPEPKPGRTINVNPAARGEIRVQRPVGAKGRIVLPEDVRKKFGRTFNQSALPATIAVDSQQRPTTNSEGKPIHPTEQGVRNFWRWFGESKVVDAQGRPLVVYHGSASAARIGAFDARKIGEANDEGFYGRGFYFTPEKQLATDYVPLQGGYVETVFLKAENPFVWDLTNPEAEADTIARARALMPKAKITTTGVQQGQRQAWTAALRDAGHDAVVEVRKSVPEGWRGAAVEGEDARAALPTEPAEIVVFAATQIKAIDNTGTFNPTDARILYQSDPIDLFGPQVGPVVGPESRKADARQRLQMRADSPLRPGDRKPLWPALKIWG